MLDIEVLIPVYHIRIPVVIPPRVRRPAHQTPLSGRWPVRIGDLVLAVCKQKPPVVHTESPRSQAPELAQRSVYLYLAASAPPLLRASLTHSCPPPPPDRAPVIRSSLGRT
ncbi:hypothetical protein KGM_214136 [Danaus plexippus plexippus]|uniref:Uncharacterized protein n=1 Tax=Danaus plexippus plexippus TaxID=278856 RepID=A0A212F7B9_DANPL|nr:hypothetical protein KGM_214136 [Danaus plexippus plexippus]